MCYLSVVNHSQTNDKERPVGCTQVSAREYGSRHSLICQADLGMAGEPRALLGPAGAGLVAGAAAPPVGGGAPWPGSCPPPGGGGAREARPPGGCPRGGGAAARG